jgi:hypothetical protein
MHPESSDRSAHGERGRAPGNGLHPSGVPSKVLQQARQFESGWLTGIVEFNMARCAQLLVRSGRFGGRAEKWKEPPT